MFFATHTIIEADHHRQALLDEAANHRLAKLARAGRRGKHRPAPAVPLPDRTGPDRTAPDPGLPQPARSVVDRAA